MPQRFNKPLVIPLTDSEIHTKMELHLDAGGPELDAAELTRWDDIVKEQIRKHRPALRPGSS